MNDLEHFDNDGPLKKKYNVAMCCRRCNSSKGTMSLSAWFKTPYCLKRKINEKTVSKPAKEYNGIKKAAQATCPVTALIRQMTSTGGTA